MKKLNALLLLLGLVFLVCLVWKIGIVELWNEMASLSWGLALFILLEFAAEGIHAVGWSYCLAKPRGRVPLFRLFRIRIAGYAISYLTPTAALGGEVTKAALLSADYPGTEAVSGVLLGRLCHAVGHLLFVAMGSVAVLWSANLPRAAWVGMFLSSALVGIGMLVFLLLQKYGKLGALVRWLADRKFGGRALQKAAQEISKVDEALITFYRERPGDLILAVCWHLFANSLGMLQTWCFLYFLRVPASATVAAEAWILGLWFDMLTFAVPLNLGTLEGSRVVAFKAIGLGAVPGMTYGIALRLAQLACAAFGLANYALLTSRNRQSPAGWPRASSDSKKAQHPMGSIGLENESS